MGRQAPGDKMCKVAAKGLTDQEYAL